jgi:hypothetical protein
MNARRRTGILLLRFLLERQRHDLEPAVVVLPVQLGEERRLVVAVRAPAAAMLTMTTFAPELRIGVGDELALSDPGS